MPQIRPISDLRNNFADISRTVHDSEEPVFLTKNGYGDMVVMSVELYEKLGIASMLLAQKPQQAPAQEAGTSATSKKNAKKSSPAAELKIQKPLSKWQKTLSDLASK